MPGLSPENPSKKAIRMQRPLEERVVIPTVGDRMFDNIEAYLGAQGQVTCGDWLAKREITQELFDSLFPNTKK